METAASLGGGEKRHRNPPATREKILSAAKTEFALNGLAGARVDVIAQRASTNKRMIYHYFESKETLFRHVLEEQCSQFIEAQSSLDIVELDASRALERIVDFLWYYFLENPAIMVLLHSENLQHATNLKRTRLAALFSKRMVFLIDEALRRGMSDKPFSHEIDASRLYRTIEALCFHHISMRSTNDAFYSAELPPKDNAKAELEWIHKVVSAAVQKAD